MKSLARQLGFIVLVAALFFVWNTQTDRDVVGAQAAPTPIKATRLYTGADGLKGHITRNFGPEYRVMVFIPLADQKVEIGPLKTGQ